jgi:hypothetical protein
MKKLVALLALGVGFSHVYGQKINESEVPVAVRSAFAKAHPTAKEVKWEKEKGAFEVNFDQDKKDMSNVLDANGAILEEETEMVGEELPAAVRGALLKDFATFKVTEAAKILAKGVTTFEAEVEKGNDHFDLIFDTQGKLLKKIKKEKGKEDKD